MLQTVATRPLARHAPNYSPAEIGLSGLGGLLGMALTLWLSTWLLGADVAVTVLASMGASAVLLFAVPHSAFSSPWAVLGGHGVSACIGVACAELVRDPLLAASLAVGLSIVAMYALNCIHPPGGATAFFAVMGGPALHALGFSYVLAPTLLNAVLLLGVALLFNGVLRAGQAAHVAEVEAQAALPPEVLMIKHDDLMYALGEIRSFIDVSEDDLMHIYKLALQHAIHPQSALDSPARA